MVINQHYNGTIIGGVFTIASLLMIFTFFVPLISIFPGVIIELMMASLVDNEPYSNVVKATITTFMIFLIISLAIFLVRSRQTEFKNKNIIGIMVFEYFIVHPLGFYLYWATTLDYRGDGQLFFGALTSFRVSSFGFILIGILIDLIKKKPSQIVETNT